MRKYLKNKNEYIEDGKHYVEKIRKCSVWKKRGDVYLLNCKIIQRGTNIYTYDNADYLTFFSEKKRWLSEEAKQTVVEAVEVYEQTVKEIKEGDYTLIPIEKLATTVYLKRQDRYGFHFMLEYYDEKEGEQLITQIFRANTIGEMMREICFCLSKIERGTEIHNLLSSPSRESIHQRIQFLRVGTPAGDGLFIRSVREQVLGQHGQTAVLSDRKQPVIHLKVPIKNLI